MPIEAWAIEPTERQSDVLGYASVLLESAFSEGQADVDVVSGKSWNGWSLGEEIKSYILTDDGVALTPVSYWPVFYGECVVGSIKAVYGDDGSTTYVLTEELAADIEEANRLQSGAVILFDSEWEASIIRDDATAKQMRGLSQEGQNSGMSYTVQQVSCPISFLADDRQNTSNAESMHLNAHADSGELPEEVPSGGISAAYSAPMLNVPKLYQGSKPLCWAYSVASIGQYMTGVTLLTPERIASLTGGTNGEIPTALSYYKYQNSDTSIGATAWEGSALGDWEIQNWISNGIPIYAHLHVSGSSPARRHAVVVCGWNKTSSGAFTVTVMNPGHGAYEIMTKDSGGVLSLQYNSAGFRWDSGGVVLTGWQKPGNGSNWCWMNGNGTREKGWFSPPGDSNYYWFDSSGYMVTNNWVSYNGKWYHLGASGAMDTGWFKSPSSGYWYYLGSDGAARTGWNSIGGYWYVFDSGGAMYRGWYQDGSTWYYLRTASNVPSGGPEGSMLCNGTWTINGKAYRFDSSGACLNP